MKNYKPMTDEELEAECAAHRTCEHCGKKVGADAHRKITSRLITFYHPNCWALTSVGSDQLEDNSPTNKQDYY